ncbi:unnamed protein product [Allacma fusca]|uniref:Peptidase S1 domain-containing protein n=1 Tax=Allacma fusca TaxID=39272 RepID=A0A8J2JTY5_9HEXA|nr:unnamed protein product [Allacma fusca]
MYFASEKLLLKYKMVFHLLFLLSLLTDKADPGTVKPQIIGGEDARPGEFPWMISIQYFTRDMWEHACGGAIIDHRHIISAAHCWLSKELPHRVYLKITHSHGTTTDGAFRNHRLSRVNKHLRIKLAGAPISCEILLKL